MTLKAADGRVITLPLDKLSPEDQDLARKLSTASEPVVPPTKPDADESNVEATAKGTLKQWVTIRDDKEITSYSLDIEVDLIGGDAAEAYSVGPVTAEPVVVDGKKMAMEDMPGAGGFEAIDRSETGFFAEHPENGVRAEISYGKVPEKTSDVGPIKGSVKVLVGGTERIVSLTNLATRPTSDIEDAILSAAGFAAKFTRQDIGGGHLDVGVEMSGESAKAFVGMKLVGADGEEIPASSGSFSSEDMIGHSKSAERKDLEGASLKLEFREGLRELEIPFEFASVKVEK